MAGSASSPASPTSSATSLLLHVRSSHDDEASATGHETETARHRRRTHQAGIYSPIPVHVSPRSSSISTLASHWHERTSRRAGSGMYSESSGLMAPRTYSAIENSEESGSTTPRHSLPVTGAPRNLAQSSESDDNNDDADLSLPLLSPSAASAHAASHSPDRAYFPHQPKSLAGIAVRSFCLGIALTLGVGGTVGVVVFTSSPLWRLPFFLASLSLFHFLEFWTTAAYNTRAAEVGSFLLTANWPGYAIAHSAATFECLLTNLAWPDRSWAPLHTAPLLCLMGLMLVVVGQTVRSVAMVQAGPSFNHLVQHQRSSGHVLVTTGLYGRLRHPSYFGFFWWALGTQLVLGNVVSFFAYAAVLWKFFSTRIRHEEELLVKFFGDEYIDYRDKVPTMLPFVS
ncbi:Isoprenylcysteine carboxyl methyltransferase family-domain-containing protein [Diplogelasinospora grovesii]|uniref:Protein-S-isoprenylcysteine O-methyltransferase n=1 Tax=Diplogelasinospora grovesii TaxID=303347 RepID=A0AAN6ND89_9PEZI|nr:Isoprenylcysteine carboxyl methyltransferase family-domain-containing protein [Diplogelasinospora grovesii]